MIPSPQVEQAVAPGRGHSGSQNAATTDPANAYTSAICCPNPPTTTDIDRDPARRCDRRSPVTRQIPASHASLRVASGARGRRFKSCRARSLLIGAFRCLAVGVAHRVLSRSARRHSRPADEFGPRTAGPPVGPGARHPGVTAFDGPGRSPRRLLAATGGHNDCRSCPAHLPAGGSTGNGRPGEHRSSRLGATVRANGDPDTLLPGVISAYP